MIKSDSYLLFRPNNKIDRNNSHIFKSSPGGGGFTIVELLVVIVVIGILAAITIIAYVGISSRAIATSMQSDLTNNSQQLKLYAQVYSSYPTALNASNCPTAPTADNNYCLKTSPGNTLTYNVNTATNPQTFGLTVTNANNTSYRITSSSAPLACPLNFIIVPGSTTYGTSDFCVMKYEAKQVGATTTPISQAAGLPWVNISQATAITNAPNVAGCTGCHLITEAEWMTIAQNVLSVPSNWSGNAVGSGYIYSGHNDNVPANALAATTDDTDVYNGTGNTYPSSQDRTLTLTNGEVIWDLAGNVWEWTNGVNNGILPGAAGNDYNPWLEWPNVTIHGTLALDPFPNTTGIPGSSTWTSTNGIGMLISGTSNASTRVFLRGGGYYSSSNGGILAINFNYPSSFVDARFGFRVSK